MSSPALDLQQILAGRSSIAGKVISVAGGVAEVATARGVVELPYNGGVYDRVTVRDGRAVKVQDTVDAPVFRV